MFNKENQNPNMITKLKLINLQKNMLSDNSNDSNQFGKKKDSKR